MDVNLRVIVPEQQKVQEQGPIVNLPTEPNKVLISIIQNMHFVEQRGLLFASKMFYAQVCANVKSVVLINKKQVECLSAIVAQLNKNDNLEMLNNWCPERIEVNFNSVTQFKKLTALVIGNGCEVRSEDFLSFTAFEKLRHLEIDKLKGDSATIAKVIGCLSVLEVLRIRGFIANNSERFSLPTSLKRVGLWAENGCISDQVLTDSSKLKLTELILASVKINSLTSFKDLGKMTTLSHLGLFVNFDSNQPLLNITDQRVAELQNLNLSSLHLGGVHLITNESVPTFCKWTNLSTLALTRADQITGVFLDGIKTLNLRFLHLARCPLITDEDLQVIHSTLTRLDLEASSAITNAGLKIIANHRNIKELNLAGLPNIDYKGLQPFTTLTALCVKQCQKMDARVEGLPIPNIRYIPMQNWQ